MNNRGLGGVSSRLVVGLGLALFLTSALALASTPQGHFEKTFQVTGPVSLEVQTHSGDIIVRGGPAGTVTVRGKIYVGDSWFSGKRQGDVQEIEQHPPIRQDGNSIHIDYVNAHNISVDYEITVPAATSIRRKRPSGSATPNCAMASARAWVSAIA